MITATSSTISEQQKNEESGNSGVTSYSFTINTGFDGSKIINDELLDNSAAAKERAVSEFIQFGYSPRTISFTTYRGDLILNQHLKVRGRWYKIKNISPTFNDTSGTFNIQAERYE